ncbi:spheroidene monooxygenase [Ferruginibacter sp. HRS2-29]|uniref:spheroidene monooxygenase n=1 Tax=Ferruginibacter sp. HRS2-29 TaxID=2487334 RepID=UPI0020CD55E3|nr:spheroidene monooxygenase [Ferruginibacter sp. HRS2-29]MCP9750066.1 spheroidene monooxygenase [Ferruginibacter sp. HRS2-29]
MTTSLTIVRYKKRFIPFAFFSMAIFHLPLRTKKNISFYKLMGSGKNGTFDKVPDLQQWAILAVHDKPGGSSDNRSLYGSLVAGWWAFFGCETFTLLLEPLESHGSWSGKKAFGELPAKSAYDGPVAVLTRATIRMNKLKYFWQNVAGVANKMAGAKGFICSFGIGEMPWIRQATFSIWQSKDDMKAFAYGMKEHAEVIQKTRKQRWYSEDMFTRFRIIARSGTVKGEDPLAGML